MSESPGDDSEVRALWAEYASTAHARIRDRLIEYYLPFAKRVAARLYGMRIGDAVDFQDYVQYARLGLIESVDRFDIARGVNFEAFAIHRVRGAILNGLTHETEGAAQREYLRQSASERRDSLAAAWEHDPARATLEEIVALTVGLTIGLLMENDASVDERRQANPYESAELEQLRKSLWMAVEELPPRESQVIREHYLQQREFQAIAQEMGVTKGRVSQLHAQAIRRIQALLAEGPGLDKRL